MYEVTLAMPVYNVEQYIHKALLSVLNQSFQSLEFLIIDDCGSDKSMDIARDLLKDHPRAEHVKIIDHGVNRGTGATKNSALDAARGKYIFFMDSDDELTPTAIEELHKLIEKHKVDFVVAGYDKFTLEGEKIKGYHYPDQIIRGRSEIINHIFPSSLQVSLHWPTWNKLYNREFLRQNNIRAVDHHLIEDMTFSMKVYTTAKSFASSSLTILHYNIREGSAVSQIKEGFTLRIAQEHVEIMGDYKLTLKELNATQTYPNLYKWVLGYLLYLLSKIRESHHLEAALKKQFQEQMLKDFPFASKGSKIAFCIKNHMPKWAITLKKKLLK